MAAPSSERRDPEQHDAGRHDDWAALSSLADGEAAADAHEHCLALWATDAQARARWHDYQLIGDVLRSQELARPQAHDAAFVHALRERLQREPVVLRPPLRRAVGLTRAWGVPMAAVAGVAAVAAVTVALRAGPQSPAPTVAAVPNAAPQPVAAAQAVLPQVANGRLIRDAQLDRYFAAHRQSAHGAALQVPGAALRSVDTTLPEDR